MTFIVEISNKMFFMKGGYSFRRFNKGLIPDCNDCMCEHITVVYYHVLFIGIIVLFPFLSILFILLCVG